MHVIKTFIWPTAPTYYRQTRRKKGQLTTYKPFCSTAIVEQGNCRGHVLSFGIVTLNQ